MNKPMFTQVSFGDKVSTTTFCFNQMDDYADRMYFSLKDEDDQEEECAQCTLSLDEMEYLANRMLDAVAYQRKQLQADETQTYEKDAEQYGYLRILDALARFNYNRKDAAKFLGISVRTLYRKMVQLDIKDNH